MCIRVGRAHVYEEGRGAELACKGRPMEASVVFLTSRNYLLTDVTSLLES